MLGRKEGKQGVLARKEWRRVLQVEALGERIAPSNVAIGVENIFSVNLVNGGGGMQFSSINGSFSPSIGAFTGGTPIISVTSNG